MGALTVLVDGGLGRFDLVDCLHDYRHEVTIHGDDVLAHTNWELSENWLHRYKCVHCTRQSGFALSHACHRRFLVDQATLAIANRWRRERGESELRLADFQDPVPHATSAV